MKFKEIFIILAICAVVMFFADLLHDDELEDFSVYLRCAGGVLTVIAGVFIMGLPFIKHKDSHFIKNMDLWVLHTPEQLKYALFQLGVGLLIPVTGINIIGIGMPLYNSWGILLFQLFFVLPGLSFLILSYFVKTTYVTFAKSSQDVSFISEKFSFTVPFDSIKFITERIISGKGGSSYMVAIHSSKKPAMLFSSKVNGGVNRLSSPLLTLIATYNCTTRKEAEESIDDLLLFMAGKYDDSPSKFDDI